MTTTMTHAELYAEVQDFYARQVRLQDDAAAEEFAATFTQDGQLAHRRDQAPLRGRAEIAATAHEINKRLAADQIKQRHWFNMLSVDPGADGTVEATYYALVIRTRSAEKPAVEVSCLVRDVLVRDDDGALLTRSRTIEHD